MQLRKIVLIGRTGDGKSSTGNTILQRKVFPHKASAISVKAKCIRRDGLVHGRKITVIDTPGFFDTDRDDEEIKSEIIKSLFECTPAVHAFVIVLKVGRYTRQENEVVQQFLNTMKGEHVLKHTVILFTHGEQLEGQTIEEFVKPNSQLKELVDKCGGHCHVIDNTYWNGFDSGIKSNKVQVKNLLETIDKMVKENGCFTSELHQKLEEKIQEEIKKNEDNLPLEEKREKAKEIVYNKFCLQVVGASTGVLIGALLGVGVAVAAVIALLKPFCSVCKWIKAAKGAAGGATTVEAVAGGAAAVEAVAGGAAAVEAVAGGATTVEAVAAGAGAVAGGAAAVEAVAGGAAAVEAVAGGAAAVAGGATTVEAVAGGAAAVAGGATTVEAVAGGAAAVEAVAGGAAAVEAVAGGATTVEAVAAGGAAAVETGATAGGSGAAAGAGVGAVKAVAAGVVVVAALAGAIGGGVTGWKAAEEADSWYDAMTKAANLNYENARDVVEKVQELVTLAAKNKLE